MITIFHADCRHGGQVTALLGYAKAFQGNHGSSKANESDKMTMLPVPASPFPVKRRFMELDGVQTLSAIAPVVCALISYATYRAIDSHLAVHLAPPKPWIMPMRIGMLFGVIAPSFVGVYFANQTARAANRGLRFVGAMEMLVCGFYGAVLLFAFTVGFG